MKGWSNWGHIYFWIRLFFHIEQHSNWEKNGKIEQLKIKLKMCIPVVVFLSFIILASLPTLIFLLIHCAVTWRPRLLREPPVCCFLLLYRSIYMVRVCILVRNCYNNPIITLGTYPIIDSGPYHPLKFRDKSSSTVVAGIILVLNFRAPRRFTFTMFIISYKVHCPYDWKLGILIWFQASLSSSGRFRDKLCAK